MIAETSTSSQHSFKLVSTADYFEPPSSGSGQQEDIPGQQEDIPQQQKVSLEVSLVKVSFFFFWLVPF